MKRSEPTWLGDTRDWFFEKDLTWLCIVGFILFPPGMWDFSGGKKMILDVVDMFDRPNATKGSAILKRSGKWGQARSESFEKGWYVKCLLKGNLVSIIHRNRTFIYILITDLWQMDFYVSQLICY